MLRERERQREKKKEKSTQVCELEGKQRKSTPFEVEAGIMLFSFPSPWKKKKHRSLKN